MPEFRTFKDFNLNFKPHPVTEDLMVVKDAADIKQSIKSLLLTRKGERLFNSDIGTSLTDLLFEVADFATASLIRDEIIVVLSNYERRINILNLDVDVNFDDNGYDIELVYEIVGRDDLPTTVEFFLESAR
jgi:phage baseplate assembly protein W